MDKLIKIYHKDWNGDCIIYNNEIEKDDNKIINEENIIERLNIEDEKGILTYNENDVLIKWDKWSNDYCINIYKNLYIEKKYYETLDIKYLMNTNKNYILLFDENNQIINEINEDKSKILIDENNLMYKNNKYIKFIDNIYINYNEKNNFFCLDTINFNKKNTYILNKRNNKFYNKINFKNNGIYSINNNILTLEWSNHTKNLLKFIL